jgi:hypothetical protein
MAARKNPHRGAIEKSPDRPAIERALAMGATMAEVSRRFGFHQMTVRRFRDNHLPPQLRAAILGASLRPGVDDLEKLKADEAAGLLGNLAHQRARLLLLQDRAMEVEAFDATVKLSNTIHRNLQLVGHYLGLFANISVSQNVNILLTEDYLRLRHALTTALQPYPEARKAVAEAIQRVEAETAQKLLAQAGKMPSPPTIDHEPFGKPRKAGNGAGATSIRRPSAREAETE